MTIHLHSLYVAVARLLLLSRSSSLTIETTSQSTVAWSIWIRSAAGDDGKACDQQRTYQGFAQIVLRWDHVIKWETGARIAKTEEMYPDLTHNQV